MRIPAALLLGATLSACGGAARCDMTRCPEDLTNPNVSVTYADGSGNAYVVRGGTVEYQPVTPARSSSATYSGGAPWKKRVDAPGLAEIARALNAAIDAKEAHTPNRVMMSGEITVSCGGESRRWIIAPGRAEMRAIEGLLSRLR